MKNPPLLVDRTSHVETWTLNRPEQRNAISDAEMIDALVAAVDRVNHDVQVRAVVLTGAGSAFSAGGNVKKMRDRTEAFSGLPHEIRDNYRHGIQRITRGFDRCDVPVVAAVNGPAVGAGCDLAAMCDVRIASETAWFAESFVKLGIIPGDGGAWLLPRIIGHARASEMALTGDRVSADQALAWGLVNRVVPAESLMEAASAMASRIAANPPHAVRMTKKLLREAARSDLGTVLELSAAMQPLAHETPHHMEAVNAFVEGRSPSFSD